MRTVPTRRRYQVEEGGSQPFLHFENVIGNESVSLAMHGARSLRRRGVDQAEDLAMGLIHPVAEVSDVMRALRFEVCGVGLGNVMGSGSAADSVDIHVEGH
jgi:hypothetical protein